MIYQNPINRAVKNPVSPLGWSEANLLSTLLGVGIIAFDTLMATLILGAPSAQMSSALPELAVALIPTLVLLILGVRTKNSLKAKRRPEYLQVISIHHRSNHLS